MWLVSLLSLAVQFEPGHKATKKAPRGFAALTLTKGAQNSFQQLDFDGSL